MSPFRGAEHSSMGTSLARLLDLQGEFSDPSTPLRFMMPATAQLEAAFTRMVSGRAHVWSYTALVP